MLSEVGGEDFVEEVRLPMDLRGAFILRKRGRKMTRGGFQAAFATQAALINFTCRRADLGSDGTQHNQ